MFNRRCLSRVLNFVSPRQYGHCWTCGATCETCEGSLLLDVESDIEANTDEEASDTSDTQGVSMQVDLDYILDAIRALRIEELEATRCAGKDEGGTSRRVNTGVDPPQKVSLC